MLAGNMPENLAESAKKVLNESQKLKGAFQNPDQVCFWREKKQREREKERKKERERDSFEKRTNTNKT